MPYRCETRLAARNYADPAERRAFRRGYGDGYDGKPVKYGVRSGYASTHPNAYAAGYHEGAADKLEVK